MKQRLGLGDRAILLNASTFAQQKAKQNAREDNASFMFTESQLNEDDDAAQSTSALVTSNNDVYLSNVGYLFSPMRFRVRDMIPSTVTCISMGYSLMMQKQDVSATD